MTFMNQPGKKTTNINVFFAKTRKTGKTKKTIENQRKSRKPDKGKNVRKS